MDNIMKLFLTICLFALTAYASAQNGVTQTDDQKYDGMKTNNITDQEYLDAQKFHHDGKAAEIIKKECEDNKENKDKSLCDERNYSGAFGEKGSWLEDAIPMISKAYGMLGIKQILSGDDAKDMKLYEKGGKKNKTIKKNEDGKAQKDYCIFIPTATEASAFVYQKITSTNTQRSLVSDPKKQTHQREYILATAAAHKSRNTTARMQQVGYAATSACYLAFAASNSFMASWKVYAKIGASAMLSYFYTRKAKHHKDRVETLNKIADSLPNIGECSAETQTNCFCATESSQNLYPDKFQKFCVPAEYQGLANGANATSCVDGNNQIDNKCECKKTNSCLQDKLAKINPNLNGIGAILWNSSLKGLDLVNSGQFDEGKLDAWTQSNSALTKKVDGQVESKVKTPKISLNDDEKKIAQGLVDSGLSKTAAALISQGPSVTPKGLSGDTLPTLSSIKNELTKKGISFENYSPGRKKIKIHSGAPAAEPQANPYSKFLNQGSNNKVAKSDSIEYMEFVKEAQREAEIVKAPEQSIFSIIDRRYKTTGWRNLKVIEK